MAYKMITLGERDVGRIGGFAGAYADQMTTLFTRRWRSQLPKGQKIIDIRQMQLCVRADLEKLRQRIAAIEHDHLSRLTNDRLSRDVRDETIPQLRTHLLGIKILVDSGFGAGTSIKVFGLDTTIPLDAVPLKRVGRTAHTNLMSPELVLPPLQIGGVTMAPKGMAKAFEPHLFKLEEVLSKIEATLPLTSGTLARKIETLNELQQQVGIAARFLIALYHLAGEHELAKRVRRSTHRRPDPDPTSPAPAAAAAEPAPGEPEADADAVGPLVEAAGLPAIAARAADGTEEQTAAVAGDAAAEGGSADDADGEQTALPRAA